MGNIKLKLIEDLGMRFPKETSKQKKRYCKYLCECGNTFEAMAYDVKREHTTSCGCVHKNAVTKHSGAGSRLYTIWNNMKQRCLNINSKDYKEYGGRGISICDDWIKDFIIFKEWSELNGYTDNLSIDRRNNDKGYYPDNCRWATRETQSQNTRAIQKNNTSGYKGVTFDKQKRKWLVGIMNNSRRKFLGYFDSAKEGAIVRDAYIHINNLEHTPSIGKMERASI